MLQRAEAARREGRYHEALQLSDRAAVIGEDARYHAALVRGDILMELGDPAAALSSYESIADPSIPDPELDCARGIALFELAKLPEAENALRSALRGRPDLAEAYFVLGMIAEMLGTGEDVELFRMARRLEPERFPPAPQRSREVFEALLEHALTDLPAEIEDVLRDVSVVVADVPYPDDLTRSDPPMSPGSLAMFVSPGYGDASEAAALVLFKRNLERSFPDTAELSAELRSLVIRELAAVVGIEPPEEE